VTHSKISLLHPTSNPNNRQVALALYEAELLFEIITTFAYNPNSSISKLIDKIPYIYSHKIKQELERRMWSVPQGTKLKLHPIREILRMLLVKSCLSHYLGFGSRGPIDWVYKSLDEHVSKYHLDEISAVYAYEDCASLTFTEAKERGIVCLYDLPILYYRTAQQIQREEAELFPELKSSLQAINEPEWKLERKHNEINLADHIFVASSVTGSSLLKEGISPSKITIIKYGAPTDLFYPDKKSDGIFRVLFVGRVGPRKGIHYLLNAWKSLNLTNAEMLLVGIDEFPEGWLEKNIDSVRYISSVPYHKLNRYYNDANVFVLPSLIDGFGLVLLEAMSCGIPVITTTNTAGPDIITDGVEGFVVPIRDVDSIKEKIEWSYDNPSKLNSMGRAARRKAEELTWSDYRIEVTRKIVSLMPNNDCN